MQNNGSWSINSRLPTTQPKQTTSTTTDLMKILLVCNRTNTQSKVKKKKTNWLNKQLGINNPASIEAVHGGDRMCRGTGSDDAAEEAHLKSPWKRDWRRGTPAAATNKEKEGITSQIDTIFHSGRATAGVTTRTTSPIIISSSPACPPYMSR